MSKKFLYNFGMSQEDEHTECAALGIGENSRVLSVCSAGEMPLSLLALGAGQVDAIDIDENQLHLAQLKKAAVLTLERTEAIGFLGYIPTRPGERATLFRDVEKALPANSRSFWRGQLKEVRHGAVWAGRYERYVNRLVRLLKIFMRKSIEGLFECETVEQQRDYFQRTFNKRRYRAVFDLAFHPKVFSKRGMDPRSLEHRDQNQSLSRQYFDHFRALCTATPVKENHLLQLHLLSRVLSTDAVPTYLTQSGFERVRERIGRLSFQQADLVAYLQNTKPKTNDCFHLSNLPDWMPQSGFEAVMRLLAEKSDRPARLVWRYIHIDRTLPDDLNDTMKVDRELGNQLRNNDRFPFYTIVPATIGEST